jgi:hypothetical protein
VHLGGARGRFCGLMSSQEFQGEPSMRRLRDDVVMTTRSDQQLPRDTADDRHQLSKTLLSGRSKLPLRYRAF